jgi:hypothetical protein
MIKEVEIVLHEDLSLKNHLAGHQRKLMKLSFDHVQQLMDVKSELLPIVAKNKASAARADAYSVLAALADSSAVTVAVRRRAAMLCQKQHAEGHNFVWPLSALRGNKHCGGRVH